MKITKLMTLAAMPLALGMLGCEAGDADDDLDIAADSAELTAEEMAPPPATFALMAVENSGVSGKVFIEPAPGDALDETLVTVTLNAPEAAGDGELAYVPIIHSGTCDNMGAVVEELDTVETEEELDPIDADEMDSMDADDTGMTTTTEVGLPLLTINDKMVVAVHANLDDETGPVVACTAITAGGKNMGNM